VQDAIAGYRLIKLVAAIPTSTVYRHSLAAMRRSTYSFPDGNRPRAAMGKWS
jgi:hypothetical protein